MVLIFETISEESFTFYTTKYPKWNHPGVYF